MVDNYSTAESGCEHLIMISRPASITVLGAMVVLRAKLGHGIEIIEYPDRVLHIIVLRHYLETTVSLLQHG